ncbi:MAG: PspC domain-containing protein [Anaerolineae bacterium]|nr:PspC domain-containing protein [Anaerolineae bacterium]
MVRSFSNRIFGGVCGGLASATPLNAWLWRIIFIILTLVTVGAAALAYVLLWWMLPLGSPIRRSYGGAIRGLLALLLSISLIVGWFLRGRFFPSEIYLPVTFLLLALVLLMKQVAAGTTRQYHTRIGCCRHPNCVFARCAGYFIRRIV